MSVRKPEYRDELNDLAKLLDEVDQQPSILVVDDEEIIARVLAKGLAASGYRTAFASSGQDALDKLADSHFDVVLSDILMPRMRGDELLRHIIDRHKNTSVVMITASHDVELAVNCLNLGADDFLLKPYVIGEVTARISKVLEKRRLQINHDEYHKMLQKRVADQAGKLRNYLLQTLDALNLALEAKDEKTRDHSIRVTEKACAIASRIVPGDVDLRARIRIAAKFHDIGIIGVPDALLQKVEPLTPEDYQELHRHCEVGEKILGPVVEGDTKLLHMVRNHHERWDGTGYPDGLAANRIPLGARIIAVADAYDAMRSPRAYRERLTHVAAIDTLKNGVGTHWDPAIVAAFVYLCESGEVTTSAEG